MSAPATEMEISSIHLPHRSSAEAVQALQVDCYGMSDRGRVRPSNEDHFLIAELRKAMYVRQTNLSQPLKQYSDERGYLFLVADGMGGHQAGERASALAVQAIEDFTLNTFKWFFHLRGPEERSVLAEFQSALRRADVQVCQEAAQHPDLSGMGTTLTMAYALNDDLYVAHVGDSRCYVLCENELYHLTHDHTLVGEMVRRGALSEKEAAHHRFRHVITNVVGGDKPGVQVEVQKVRLESDDV